MEQPGIVYSIEVLVMGSILMECHSPHMTETMTSGVVTVHKVGREDGGTITVCLHNSTASTTTTQHQDSGRQFFGTHSLDLVAPSSLLK